MKHALLVTGPNASGKTTATQAAVERWRYDSRLMTVFADNSDRHRYKGDQVDMERLLREDWMSEADVLVVEGTNRIAMAFARVLRMDGTLVYRDWEANIAQVSPAFLLASMQARCALKNKTFRSDYWTDRVLTYETSRRFTVINEKWLDARARWWPIETGYAGAEALQTHIAARLESWLGEPRRDARRDLFQFCS